jgi:RimJ/RimL family protein N-acetyltransferase
LPSIVISLAANQESVARALAAQGMAIYLGRREAVSAGDIAAALESLMREPATVRTMSAACAEHVDGRGVDRVARALDARPIALRAAGARDCNAVYAWRNADETRRHAHDSAAISPAAHAEWFARTLTDPSRVLLIAECEGEPVGVLRYDCAGQQSTVSIYLVPGRYGGGFGSRVLCAGHAWLRSQRPEVRSIRAEVLPGNRASAAAFLQSGYRDDGGAYIKDLR